MSTLDRRTLLKGIGTVMALPALEAMLPSTALASSAPAQSTAVRMAFLFVPNGINMAKWTPGSVGALGELPETLRPLAPLKSKFNVITGLAQMNAFANGDGPGDHARSAATWLTGVQARKTAGSDIRAGISADQVAALSKIGRSTKFPSLEIGCERGAMAGDCDSGYSCAYSSSIAWRTESTPVAKEVTPRALFERLFGSGNPGEDAQSLEMRRQGRASVLDFIMEEAAALQGRLGGKDRQKLDEYFTSVREIEQRLTAQEKRTADSALAGVTIPAPGIPMDRGAHIRLMGDMMILAFQADLTRVATFMFANEGSNRPYREIGVTDGHHDISHHGKDGSKLQHKQQIDAYHVEQLAYILKRMSEIQEPTGSLLDNSMIVFGGGISDGDRHNHDDLPILFAGGAGGRMKGGRHMVYEPHTPMTNMFISMLDYMGVQVDKLGDSTGKLQGLF
ncbi:MAG: DUF1552 domain-containing protein [Fimbriimonadaceae bacterium]|nr:DUF1552 domain-containing protein [Fimbriimonadaceae bacterium]